MAYTAPSSNGAAITNYVIQIKTSTGAFYNETSCTGTSLYCILPMNTLTSTTGAYKLTLGTLVVVEVSATNSIGTSTPSIPNTSGATVLTVPAQMAIPTMGASSNDVQI